MALVDTFVQSYEFYRKRTFDLLSKIEQEPEPPRVLGWRPGPGRAHIAWQLMHIGVTEEIFATERLAPHKAGQWTELWPRFRGGSTPDDNTPSAGEIRELLLASRQHLLHTLKEYGDDRLSEVPEALKARNLTVRDVLSLIGWHEAHHQGQAHITYNLYRATSAGG
jgi:uncharacterized damage-inducible protein DinB